MTEIVRTQTLSNFAGLDANSSILAGIVGRRFAEHFDPDRPFLQICALTCQRIFHDVAQKTLAQFADVEFLAGEYPLQFLTHICIKS